MSPTGWFLPNIAVVGWSLQVLLSWYSTKGIGVYCKLVPANIFFQLVLSYTDWCLLQVVSCEYSFCRLVPTWRAKLVLSQGDWCILQVGSYEYRSCRLVPTQIDKLVLS